MSEAPEGKKVGVIRARAWLLGLAWIPLIAFAATNQEVDGYFSLIVAPVSALLATIIVNAVVRLIVRKPLLSAADLIVMYAICSVGGALACEWINVGHSAMHGLPIQAQFSPTVKEKILPNMPDFLAIKDMEKVRDMQTAGRDFGYVWSKIPMYAPIYAAWGAFLMLFVVGMLCINSLMRKAWTESERLAFPIIQLPVAMCESGPGSMWRSKFMWSAFAVMFLIDVLNGLNYLYPNVPLIPVKEFINLESMFPNAPLSNIGYFPISIYPFMAAIGLFMPSDLLFSVVFFFLVRKAMNVILASQGIPQGWFSGTGLAPGPPYWDEQSWGAVLAMFFGALWVTRRHLKEVWRDIRANARSDDGGIKHRWAFVGFVVCFVALTAIGVIVGGLPAPYAAGYMLLVFVFAVVLTRVRAQLGPPTHEFAYFGPHSFLYRLFGTNWINDQQGVFLSQTLQMVNRIHRTHPAPYQLESMKMVADRKLDQGKLFRILIFAMAIAILCGYFGLHVHAYRLAQPYRWGDGENYLRSLQSSPHGTDWLGVAMTGLGAALVVAMDFVRHRIPGFPLHPAGYLLSTNFGVDYYWFGLLVALLVKNFVTRYYGLAGYGKLRQVALGILLAEYGAETIWMMISLCTGHSTYTICFNERGIGSQ